MHRSQINKKDHVLIENTKDIKYVFNLDIVVLKLFKNNNKLEILMKKLKPSK